MDDIVSKYSNPLPCDTCAYALAPIGKYSRTRNCLCEKYNSMSNPKPNGVLFSNEECPQYEGKKKTAEDGGPGSGNFGHAGRPGKVGGSQKGGGKQYRGGRADIGYFSSRKDWLNGLSGEKQHEAVRFVAQKKRELSEKLERKNKIEKLWKDGMLTRDEADDAIKRLGASGMSEESTPEEYVMKNGDMSDKSKLVDYCSRARGWEENHDRLKTQNLTDDERKVFDYMTEHLPELNDEGLMAYIDLKAKAIGLPDSGNEIPEELQYASGIKERPKPKGPDYGWYGDKRSKVVTSLEGYMGEVTGENRWGVSTGRTPEEFSQLNRAFLNHIKYGPLNRRQCTSAIGAVRSMRDVIGSEPDKQYGIYYKHGSMEYTPEMINRLSDDEKKRMVDIANSVVFANSFTGEGQFKNIEDITEQDYETIERNLQPLSFVKKSEKDLLREYVLLQEKMLTGEVPSDVDIFEEAKKAKKEEEKQKKAERAKKRDEEQKTFAESDAGKAKQDTIKRIQDSSPNMFNDLDGIAIERAIRGLGVMRDGHQFITTQVVPDEIYRGVAKAYRDFSVRFPFMAGELGGFGDQCTVGSMACSKDAYNQRRTEIAINLASFSSVEKVRESYKKNRGTFWVKIDEDTPPGYADAMHELGHSLANWLHRYVYGDFKKNPVGAYDNEVAILLKKRTFKALGIEPTAENVSKEVSKYASASRLNKGATEARTGTVADEFFAECVAGLMSNSQPNRAVAEFGRQLDLFIKENNITGMSTATTETTLPKLVNV